MSRIIIDRTCSSIREEMGEEIHQLSSDIIIKIWLGIREELSARIDLRLAIRIEEKFHNNYTKKNE